MRDLSLDEIADRFVNHKPIKLYELDQLFDLDKIPEENIRWLLKGYRNILTFDIEAMQFDVRMGFMICWFAERWDLATNEKQIIYDQLEEPDMKANYRLQKMDFDKRILGTLSEQFEWADVVAGHYISKFDLPYYCSRCNLTKQDELVPQYGDFKVLDTWRITKNKYNLYNSGGNSLRNAGKVIIGYDDKTSVDLEIWKTMYYKSHPKWKSCRKYIADHCEIDVQQNSELVSKLMKRIPVGGSSI